MSTPSHLPTNAGSTVVVFTRSVVDQARTQTRITLKLKRRSLRLAGLAPSHIPSTNPDKIIRKLNQRDLKKVKANNKPAAPTPRIILCLGPIAPPRTPEIRTFSSNDLPLSASADFNFSALIPASSGSTGSTTAVKDLTLEHAHPGNTLSGRRSYPAASYNPRHGIFNIHSNSDNYSASNKPQRYRFPRSTTRYTRYPTRYTTETTTTTPTATRTTPTNHPRRAYWKRQRPLAGKAAAAIRTSVGHFVRKPMLIEDYDGEAERAGIVRFLGRPVPNAQGLEDEYRVTLEEWGRVLRG